MNFNFNKIMRNTTPNAWQERQRGKQQKHNKNKMEEKQQQEINKIERQEAINLMKERKLVYNLFLKYNKKIFYQDKFALYPYLFHKYILHTAQSGENIKYDISRENNTMEFKKINFMHIYIVTIYLVFMKFMMNILMKFKSISK